MLVVSSTIPHVRHKKLHLLFRADDTNATLQLRWFCSHCSELLLAKVNLDFISTKILRGVRSHNINKCSLLSKYLLCRKNIILFELISPPFSWKHFTICQFSLFWRMWRGVLRRCSELWMWFEQKLSRKLI